MPCDSTVWTPSWTGVAHSASISCVRFSSPGNWYLFCDTRSQIFCLLQVCLSFFRAVFFQEKVLFKIIGNVDIMLTLCSANTELKSYLQRSNSDEALNHSVLTSPHQTRIYQIKENWSSLLKLFKDFKALPIKASSRPNTITKQNDIYCQFSKTTMSEYFTA